MLDYSSGVTAVTASATLVATVPPVNGGILVSNTGSATVYLGGANVTTANGFPLAAAATVTVPTVGNYPHSLYAVSATSSTVAFLAPTNPQ